MIDWLNLVVGNLKTKTPCLIHHLAGISLLLGSGGGEGLGYSFGAERLENLD